MHTTFKNLTPYIKYKPVITPQWIVDINLGVGQMGGSFTDWQSNEAGTVKDKYRIGSTIPIKVEVGARYRITPVWFAGLQVGYLAAKFSELQRGNVVDITAKALDFSGAYMAITLGGEFLKGIPYLWKCVKQGGFMLTLFSCFLDIYWLENFYSVISP